MDQQNTTTKMNINYCFLIYLSALLLTWRLSGSSGRITGNKPKPRTKRINSLICVGWPRSTYERYIFREMNNIFIRSHFTSRKSLSIYICSWFQFKFKFKFKFNLIQFNFIGVFIFNRRVSSFSFSLLNLI